MRVASGDMQLTLRCRDRRVFVMPARASVLPQSTPRPRPRPQTMQNRINFLQSEESKLDRDIENARKRTRDLLARKVEKAEKLRDDDVLCTAKDIIGALGPAPSTSKPLRPTTGEWQAHGLLAGLHAMRQLSCMRCKPGHRYPVLYRLGQKTMLLMVPEFVAGDITADQRAFF